MNEVENLMKFLTGLMKFILNAFLCVAVWLTFMANTNIAFMGVEDTSILEVAISMLNSNSSGTTNSYVDAENAPTVESFADVKNQIDNDEFDYSDLLDAPVYFAAEKVLSFSDRSLASLLNLAIGNDESKITSSPSTRNSPDSEENSEEELKYFISSFTTSKDGGKYYISTAVKITIPEELLAKNIPEGFMGNIVERVTSGSVSLKIKTRVDINEDQLVITTDEVEVFADFIVKAVIKNILGDDVELNNLVNSEVVKIINNLGYVDDQTFGTGTTKITVRVK